MVSWHQGGSVSFIPPPPSPARLSKTLGRLRAGTGAGFCLVSVLPHGGGGGGSGRISGWVSVPPPPPPGVGWDFVGALGSIEPVPLLSFFCCRFHVTCLFMVCLHGIAYHVCMPHAHKGARMHCHLCQMRRGRNLVFCIACLSWVRGWVGGWVGVRPPPPGRGWDICRSVGMPKFWVGGSLN